MSVRKDSVLIGYVSAGDVRAEFTASLNGAVAFAIANGLQIGQQPHMSGPRIAAARNHQVETFLTTDFEWLLMIDTDMTFKHDAIWQFLQVADREKAPIVGGLTFGKGRDGIFPTIYRWNGERMIRYEGWESDTMMPADGTGAACLMVHRSVFEKMREHFKEPWVWFEESTMPGIDGGDEGRRQIGEDLTFCIRARALEFPIFVHTGIQFGHVKAFEIDPKFYEDWNMAHRLIITGTGRCGTGYLSKVFQVVKVPALHERIFNPTNTEFPPWARADSSWLAAPFLGNYPDAYVVHLVRNPLDTVKSFVGIRFFDDSCTSHGPYREFALEHCPEAFKLDDPTERAMAFYVLWNRRIEPHADVRVQVESVTADDLYPAVKASGNMSMPWEIQQALDLVPSNVNTRTRAGLTWDDLPAGRWRDELEMMAKEYGYEVAP